MGADGGVAWIRVSDVKAFENLIAPWLGFINGTGSDVGDDSRDDYWKSHELPPSCFLSSYGTDLGDIQLDHLPSFMAFLERLLEDPFYGLHEDSTFCDIYLERKTRPAGAEWNISAYNPYDGQSFAWLSDFVFGHHKDKSFFERRIRDWLKELDALLGEEGRVVQTEETWT